MEAMRAVQVEVEAARTPQAKAEAEVAVENQVVEVMAIPAVAVLATAISAEAVSAEAETPTSGAIGRCLTCEDEGVLGW